MTKAEMLSRLEKAQILIDSVMASLPATDAGESIWNTLMESNNFIGDAESTISGTTETELE